MATSLLGDIFTPEYLLTPEYANMNILYKYGYALATLKLKIFTYYTAFCLIDSATIASGLMYNGEDEKTSKFLTSTNGS